MLNLFKTCVECGLSKHEDDFYSDGKQRKDGITRKRKNCKQCCQKRRRQYFQNFTSRAKINARRRKDYANDEGYRKRRNKRHALKALYGMSLEDFDSRRADQNFKCAVCGRHENDLYKGLFVDHCHITLIVRGLLCNNCNNGLGKFQDSPELLVKASNYLLKNKKLG